MGDGADLARDRQWDEFCFSDIFYSFPKVRNPFILVKDFQEAGQFCLLDDLIFQINYNAKQDAWFQKDGSKVKISEMNNDYKNAIVKFLAKKKIKAPKQFLMEG